MSLPDIPCLTNTAHSYSIHRFDPPPSDQIALPLYIPSCLSNPPHRFHPPPPDQPVRIEIEGPLLALQKLLPDASWFIPHHSHEFLMHSGAKLAALTFRTLYGRDARPDIEGDMVLRAEYKGVLLEADPVAMFDYYGITFDHLIPAHDTNPEVLQINVIEIEDDFGVYANKYNCFVVDPAEYIRRKVLAVPRCCQTRIGTTDRLRINRGVNDREGAGNEAVMAAYLEEKAERKEKKKAAQGLLS